MEDSQDEEQTGKNEKKKAGRPPKKHRGRQRSDALSPKLDARARKREHNRAADIMQDTPSLDGLILHYQSENSPQTKRKVTGLLQAQAYKQKYSLSDTEAVRLVPELMQFPEDD